MKRGLTGFALSLLALGAARDAFAYCSATSCDPSDVSQGCRLDPKTECELTGQPLRWASRCITFSLQKDAAPGAGIDYDAARASLERALAAWLGADCGDGTPSLAVELSPPVSCANSEYNKSHRNANVVIFREDAWPYEGGEDALGLTRVRFDPDTNVGELWDTDIEINAVDEPLRAGEPADDEVDLDSLMTHEVGHALGLAHSLDVQATMVAGYFKGSTGLRSLAADDVSGVCEKYPPGRKASSTSCEPRHGFSEKCGADQPASEPPLPLEPPSDEGSRGCGVSVAPLNEICTLFAVAAVLAAARGRRRRSRAT